jgi:DNA-binding transcriptional LysR family regulator
MDSDMDSSLLKVFVAVEAEGSFSGAAKRLHYVQSNITARIKQLEDSIGRPLFHRKPRGVALTVAGEVLLPHAKEIVKRMEDVELAMKNLGDVAGRIRIGSIESNAAVRLTPLLVDLHQKYPKVDFQLYTGTTQQVLEELLDYQLDIAFVSGVPSHPDIEVLKVIPEKMVLVEPADGIVPDVVITFKRGCTYKAFLDDIMLERGVAEYRVMEFGSLDTILGCVAAGMGRTLLPMKVVEQVADMSAVRVVNLTKEQENIPTCLICRKDARPAFEINMFDMAEETALTK